MYKKALSMFKKEDKVVCIDDNGKSNITKGKVYTVIKENIGDNTILIEGNNYECSYYSYRFKLYNPKYLPEWF